MIKRDLAVLIAIVILALVILGIGLVGWFLRR
jgi:hypothetical protein